MLNLDSMSEDELRDCVPVFADLREYAANKAQAVNYRLRGFVGAAKVREDKCEEIFRRLPEWARW